MAHFAQLNENNIVLQVIVVDNKDAPTEQEGIDYIVNVLKLEGTWIQTSYNGNMRGKFAAVMDIYNPKKDEFTVNLNYIEEQNKKALEKQKEIEVELVKKEAIASKLGLTVEELSAILH
jgi:hypothetical protein